MKLLVTGGTGFIGRHLCTKAVGDGHEITVLSRSGEAQNPGVEVIAVDLSEFSATVAAFERAGADRCIHLSWFTAPSSYKSSVSGNLSSLRSSTIVLEACKELGLPLLLAGSCLEDAENDPQLPYAAAKRCAHALAQTMLSDAFACAHIAHLYGPGEHPSRLVPTVVRHLLNDRDVDVLPADVSRDYLYVEDVADALLRIATAGLVGKVYVGSGAATPLRELLDPIAAEIGGRGRISYGSYAAPTEAPPIQQPVELVASGWQAHTDIAAGIARTIAWWREREQA